MVHTTAGQAPLPLLHIECGKASRFGGGTYLLRSDDEIAVHLYGGAETTLPVAGRQVQMRETSAYPWDGDVRITLDPSAETSEFTLSLPEHPLDRLGLPFIHLIAMPDTKMRLCDKEPYTIQRHLLRPQDRFGEPFQPGRDIECFLVPFQPIIIGFRLPLVGNSQRDQAWLPDILCQRFFGKGPKAMQTRHR